MGFAMTRSFGNWACLLGLLMSACAAAHDQHPQQRVQRASASWPIDAFTLTDQHGQAFTQERLAGRWTFVLFGNASCAAPCTDGLTALESLLRRIARAAVHKVTQVLFVSTESRQHVPARLRGVPAPFDKGFLAVPGRPARLKG